MMYSIYYCQSIISQGKGEQIILYQNQKKTQNLSSEITISMRSKQSSTIQYIANKQITMTKCQAFIISSCKKTTQKKCQSNNLVGDKICDLFKVAITLSEKSTLNYLQNVILPVYTQFIDSADSTGQSKSWFLYLLQII